MFGTRVLLSTKNISRFNILHLARAVGQKQKPKAFRDFPGRMVFFFFLLVLAGVAVYVLGFKT